MDAPPKKVNGRGHNPLSGVRLHAQSRNGAVEQRKLLSRGLLAVHPRDLPGNAGRARAALHHEWLPHLDNYCKSFYL